MAAKQSILESSFAIPLSIRTGIAAAIFLSAAASTALISASAALGWPATIAIAWFASEIAVRKVGSPFMSGILSALFGIACFGYVQHLTGSMPLAAAFTAATSWFYFLRFRTALSGIVIATALISCVFSLAEANVYGTLTKTTAAAIEVIAGLSVLVVAAVLDRRDTDRSGVNANVSFWLHLYAAPMLLHGTLHLIGGSEVASGFPPMFGSKTGAGAFAASKQLLILIAAFATVAISFVTNRWTMLLAAVGYVAMSVAIRTGDTSLSWFLSAAGAGVYLLVVDHYWPKDARAISLYD